MLKVDQSPHVRRLGLSQMAERHLGLSMVFAQHAAAGLASGMTKRTFATLVTLVQISKPESRPIWVAKTHYHPPSRRLIAKKSTLLRHVPVPERMTEHSTTAEGSIKSGCAPLGQGSPVTLSEGSFPRLSLAANLTLPCCCKLHGVAWLSEELPNVEVMTPSRLVTAVGTSRDTRWSV